MPLEKSPALESQDLEVSLDPNRIRGRRRVAVLRGWKNRHEPFPAVVHNVQLAGSSPAFLLMYRGDRRPPSRDVFLFGIKSRPALYEGDLTRLEYEVARVADDVVRFTHLLDAFLRSPMAKRAKVVPTRDRILSDYCTSDRARRIRLAQLLGLAIQYQNSQRDLRTWRDLVFLVSCSRRDDVALRYAVAHRSSEGFPDSAYIYEYAPPATDSLHEPAVEVLKDFEALGFDSVFPDRDNEIFVKMAMLPHYILGYAELRRVSADGVRGVYGVNYHPNPPYASGQATLESPPNLTDRQKALIRQTKGRVAWLYWNRQSADWQIDRNM